MNGNKRHTGNTQSQPGHHHDSVEHAGILAPDPLRNIHSLSFTDTSYLFSPYQIDFLLCGAPDAWLLSAVSAVTISLDLCIRAWPAKHKR